MSRESSIDSDDFIWSNLNSSDPDLLNSSTDEQTASEPLSHNPEMHDYQEYFEHKLATQAQRQHSSKSSVDWSRVDSKHSRTPSRAHSRQSSSNFAIRTISVAPDDDDIDVELIRALEKIADSSQPFQSSPSAQNTLAGRSAAKPAVLDSLLLQAAQPSSSSKTPEQGKRVLLQYSPDAVSSSPTKENKNPRLETPERSTSASLPNALTKPSAGTGSESQQMSSKRFNSLDAQLLQSVCSDALKETGYEVQTTVYSSDQMLQPASKITRTDHAKSSATPSFKGFISDAKGVEKKRPVQAYDPSKGHAVMPCFSAGGNKNSDTPQIDSVCQSPDPPSAINSNEIEQSNSLKKDDELRDRPKLSKSVRSANSNKRGSRHSEDLLALHSRKSSTVKSNQNNHFLPDDADFQDSKADGQLQESKSALAKSAPVPAPLDLIASSPIDDILLIPESPKIFSQKLYVKRSEIGMPGDNSDQQRPQSIIEIAHNDIDLQPDLKQSVCKRSMAAPWLPDKKIPLDGRRPSSPSPSRNKTETHTCPSCLHKRFYEFPRRQLEAVLVHAVRSGVDVDRLMKFMKEDPGTQKLDNLVTTIMKLRDTRTKKSKSELSKTVQSRGRSRAQPGAI